MDEAFMAEIEFSEGERAKSYLAEAVRPRRDVMKEDRTRAHKYVTKCGHLAVTKIAWATRIAEPALYAFKADPEALPKKDVLKIQKYMDLNGQ